MSWSPRETYDYLVCFAALMLTVLAVVLGADSALDLALPDPAYRADPVEMRLASARPSDVPSAEELERLARRRAVEEQERQRRWAIKRLGQHAVLLAVVVPLFAVHWRRVRRRERTG